jgi:hypothetical protein
LTPGPRPLWPLWSLCGPFGPRFGSVSECRDSLPQRRWQPMDQRPGRPCIAIWAKPRDGERWTGGRAQPIGSTVEPLPPSGRLTYTDETAVARRKRLSSASPGPLAWRARHDGRGLLLFSSFYPVSILSHVWFPLDVFSALPSIFPLVALSCFLFSLLLKPIAIWSWLPSMSASHD